MGKFHPKGVASQNEAGLRGTRDPSSDVPCCWGARKSLVSMTVEDGIGSARYDLTRYRIRTEALGLPTRDVTNRFRLLAAASAVSAVGVTYVALRIDQHVSLGVVVLFGGLCFLSEQFPVSVP